MTKTAKTITEIAILSPTYSVTNIDVAYKNCLGLVIENLTGNKIRFHHVIITVTLSNLTSAAPYFSVLSFVKTNSTPQREGAAEVMFEKAAEIIMKSFLRATDITMDDNNTNTGLI